MAAAGKRKTGKERRSFGDAVASLLDTYSRCLALLKGLGRGERTIDVEAMDDAASILSKSIRSDKSYVRRAYDSGLKRRGASFEKGDSAARSSLRRVVRKLTSTLANLMRTFTSQPVDHASLMSLSNASRLDAIRTMSDLSSRVGSTTSLRSTRSRKSTKSRSGRQKSRSHDGVTEAKDPSRRHRSKSSKERPKERPKSDVTKNDREAAAAAAAAYNKRISVATMSSESTKLGEIRAARVQNPLHQKVTYPLYADPYRVGYDEMDTKKKRRWFGLFGNK
jgi:hypothetical protein